jgi:UDP-glucose 4-epimerase
VRVLVTGSAGFIAGYLVEELLRAGHEVVGIDNFSKYGRVSHSYDDDPGYEFHEGDAGDEHLLYNLGVGCDQIVAGAAMIGGIAYFHEYAYRLLAENERITGATFNAALRLRNDSKLSRIVVISSSMVYENASSFPTREGEERRSPPPFSSYGFQKLATEYYARAAWSQYRLPYTIVRPFNCVGIGEREALPQGNERLALSHVVPDLIRKVLDGQYPLRLLGDGRQVRHFTYGGDLARGIRLAMESQLAVNEDFNLSTAESTRIIDLAQEIWGKIRDDQLTYVCDPPYEFDVPLRMPDVTKARRVLDFEATTTLSEMLDEVIDWMRRNT